MVLKGSGVGGTEGIWCGWYLRGLVWVVLKGSGVGGT